MVISQGSGLYRHVEGELEGADQLVRLVLIGTIVVAVFLLIQPSRSARLAGALWFPLP